MQGSNLLTDRQRDIVQMLAGGKRMKEAASILGITARTVAFHKYRIMKQPDLKTNADLVRYAARHHFIAAWETALKGLRR
jgi:DNA-binding CsgD family transcriptional regulator